MQERKSSQTAGTYVASDRLYNTAGLLASQSAPYFSSGSSYTSPTSSSTLYTSYTYDALKRVLTTGNVVGTTTNLYAKWTTTTTDPNGNVKDYVLDAFGNLAQVVEHLGCLLTTTYTYDAANNLATTTDSQGNVRGFTYDGLGRRLTAQDLHAPGHSPFGIWSYVYDDAGNVTSQTDPKGSTTTRTYDALGRLLTESNAGTTQVTNTYDSCTYGVGNLCVASSTSAKTQNSYDILGRISSATTTIANQSFPMSYAYDRQGNVTTLTYPNGSQVALSPTTSPARSRASRTSPRKAPGAISPAPSPTRRLVSPRASPSATASHTANTFDASVALSPRKQSHHAAQRRPRARLRLHLRPRRQHHPARPTTRPPPTAPPSPTSTTRSTAWLPPRLSPPSPPPTPNCSPTTLSATSSRSPPAHSTSASTPSSSPPRPTARPVFRSPTASPSTPARPAPTRSCLVAFEGSGGVPTSATYNGQSLTLHSWTGQTGFRRHRLPHQSCTREPHLLDQLSQPEPTRSTACWR